MIPGWLSVTPEETPRVSLPLPETHVGTFGKGSLPVVEEEGSHHDVIFGDAGVSYADEEYGRAWQFMLERGEVFGVVLLESLTPPPRILTNFVECSPGIAAAFANCGPGPSGAFASCGPVPNGSFGEDMDEALLEAFYQILGGRPVVGDLLVGAEDDQYERLALGALNRVLKVGASGPEWSDSLTLTALTLGTLSLTTPLVWASVNKTGSSLADLATRSAADLSSGVLADARVQQSNVTQHQAALSIDWNQVVNEPATFPAAAHALDSATHSGTLAYTQLPTGAGTWDAGNANNLTRNAASHRFQIAGTPRVRITATGIAVDQTGVGFDPSVGLHIKKLVTAAGPVDPVAVRLHATDNSNAWSSDAFARLEFWSDDVSSPAVRAYVGAYMSAVSGNQTGLKFVVTSPTQMYTAFEINPNSGINFLYPPSTIASANTIGVVQENSSAFVRFGGAIAASTAAADTIGDIRFEVRNASSATPLEGSMRILLNAGDSVVAVARMLATGLLMIGSGVAASNPGGITAGIDIDTGANTDHSIQFRTNSVTHGMTSLAPTDCIGGLMKDSMSEGGMLIRGFTEAAQLGLRLQGNTNGENATKSTAGVGAVSIGGQKRSGTSTTQLGATANILSIRNGTDAKYLFAADALWIANASAHPPTPTGGVLLYAFAGALWSKGTDGVAAQL